MASERAKRKTLKVDGVLYWAQKPVRQAKVIPIGSGTARMKSIPLMDYKEFFPRLLEGIQKNELGDKFQITIIDGYGSYVRFEIGKNLRGTRRRGYAAYTVAERYSGRLVYFQPCGIFLSKRLQPENG